jgi:hypothetical protein
MEANNSTVPLTAADRQPGASGGVRNTKMGAGHIVASGQKRGFPIETVKPAPPQGKIKESDATGSGLSPPE